MLHGQKPVFYGLLLWIEKNMEDRNEKNKERGFLGAFVYHLSKATKDPPFMSFFFLSSIFLMIAIGQKQYPKILFIFFLYSVFGLVWRHATKDIRALLRDELLPKKKLSEEPYAKKTDDEKDYIKKNFRLTIAYQIINIVITLSVISTMINLIGF